MSLEAHVDIQEYIKKLLNVQLFLNYNYFARIFALNFYRTFQHQKFVRDPQIYSCLKINEKL